MGRDVFIIGTFTIQFLTFLLDCGKFEKKGLTVEKKIFVLACSDCFIFVAQRHRRVIFRKLSIFANSYSRPDGAVAPLWTFGVS